MIPKVQQSIRRRFNMAIIGVVAVIALLVAIVLIIYSFDRLEADLRRQIAGAVKMANTSLPTPLWQYNYDFLDDFLDALFANEQFVYAMIIAHNEVVATKTLPGAAPQEWLFLSSPQYF